VRVCCERLRYALSVKRRSRRRRDTVVTSRPSEVLIGLGLHTCIHRAECVCVL
jgi:hypothetical protein